MAYKGYDMFLAEANSGEDYACKVCDSLCSVARNVHGPGGADSRKPIAGMTG